MSLQNAVLGLVVERPGYGYELSQRLSARVAGLQASESAVYPALEALERKGYVKRRDPTGKTHRTRIMFDPTPEGVAYFDLWMDTPSPPLRGDLRWKLAVADFDRLPELIEQTRQEEQACLDRIELLTRDTEDDVLIDPIATWAPTGRLLLRRTDVKVLQAQIEALQEVRTAMKQAGRRRTRSSPRASA